MAAEPVVLTLVLGGARSGKSRYAQGLVAGGRVAFVATARDEGDAEWRRRIARHRSDRPAHWRTVEAPLDLAPALAGASPGEALLVDCLSLWLANLMHEPHAPASEDLETAVLDGTDRFLAAARGREVVVVSNEVGSATVPDHPLARQFRDLLGFVNQRVARDADRVVLVVAGIPVVLKAEKGVAS